MSHDLVSYSKELIPRAANRALDFHSRALRHLETPQGQAYCSRFSTYDGYNAKFFEQTMLLGNRFAEHLYRSMGLAEVIAVDDKILDSVVASRIQEVARSIASFDLAPYRIGFLVLSAPATIHDIHGHEVISIGEPIGVLWTPPVSGSRGVADYYVFNESSPHYRIQHPVPLLLSANHLPSTMEECFKKEISYLQERGAEDKRVLSKTLGDAFRLAATIVTIWRVMEEPIYVERERPSFSVRRHDKRKIVRPVVVLHLRKRVPLDQEDVGGDRSYTHRWEVREHLRRQPCGPGRRERKLVTVKAHVKGPKDAPFVQKDRVVVLDR